MIIAKFQTKDGDNIINEYEKKFSSESEVRVYMREHSEHPFLDLKLIELKTLLVE